MKICVYTICKNEIKFVDKWVKNVQDADYIAVLDTGSTDGTFEKLKAYQEKYPEKFIIAQQEINPWRFDVARNESMKLVPDDADVLVSTDFDELFEQKNWCDIIKKHWVIGKMNRGHYNYAWSHTDNGEKSDMFIYDKMHTRELKWIFPVHEVLWPINEETYVENVLDLTKVLTLEHFQDKTKSRSSYFELLKLAVEENPDNPHERMLLAREYLLNKDYENSLKEYLTVLKMPEIDKPEFNNVLLESLGRCADLYKVLKDYDESLWYCQEFIKEDKTYREPYFIMGEIYNEMKMYTLAEAIVKAGFEYGTRKYTWIERAPTWINWGEDVLALSEFNLGKYDEAIKHYTDALKHAPDDVRLLTNLSSCLKRKIQQLEAKSEK